MNAAQLLALELPAARPPLAWLKADAPAQAFAACFRCTHGANAGGQRVCTHPELLDMGRPQPVAVLREWGGGCGADAMRMRDPSDA